MFDEEECDHNGYLLGRSHVVVEAEVNPPAWSRDV
jgi:hypothetical protein